MAVNWKFLEKVFPKKKNEGYEKPSFKKGLTKSDVIAAVEEEKLVVAREWIELNEAKIFRGIAYHMNHLCTQFVHLNNVPDNNPSVERGPFVTVMKEKYRLINTDFGFMVKMLYPVPCKEKGLIMVFYQGEVEQEHPNILDSKMMDFIINHCDRELVDENYPIIASILRKLGEERDKDVQLLRDLLKEEPSE